MDVKVKVGVCGIPRRLELLASTLDIVEVQETFYRPRPDKYKAWRLKAGNLEFTVKAWFLITHGLNKMLLKKSKLDVGKPGYSGDDYGGLKPTKPNMEALEEVFRSAKALHARIIVFQTPPSFKPDHPFEIAEFFNTVVREGYIPVWEIRGSTIRYLREIKEITKTTEGLVIATDILKMPPPEYAADILYTRLHGLGSGTVNYRYKYTKDDLILLKDRVNWYMSEYKKETGYILFNNIYMYDDALLFKNILIREKSY